MYAIHIQKEDVTCWDVHSHVKKGQSLVQFQWDTVFSSGENVCLHVKMAKNLWHYLSQSYFNHENAHFKYDIFIRLSTVWSFWNRLQHFVFFPYISTYCTVYTAVDWEE